MGSISFTAITDGSTIDASDVNGPLNTIYDDYNGSIDSNNLADNAVTTAKITDANVTPAKWSNPYCARAYRNVNQDNLARNTNVKVLFNAETYDVGSNFDTTNSKYVAPVTGYYSVSWALHWKDSVASENSYVKIYVNGSERTIFGPFTGAITFGNQWNGNDTVYAVAGEDIELYTLHDGAGDAVDLFAASTWITISLVHQVA